MTKRRIIGMVMAGLVLSSLFAMTTLTEEAPRITQEELREELGNPGVIVVDVRANVDWSGSGLKIKGAVREDPRKLDSWMDKYPKDKILVFYCS